MRIFYPSIQKTFRNVSYFFAAGLMGLFGLQAFAEQSRDDILAAVDFYPRADVAASEERRAADYSIALGQVKKIRGFWSPDREFRVDGELIRRTAQIPDGHSAREVFNFYRKRLLNINARVLYLCEARNCGTSNAWANQVFKVKELYGLDSNQFYGVYEVVDEDEHLNYIAVYTVARGNKRVFAHLELLMTETSSDKALAPDPKAIAKQLNDDGFYVVSGISENQGKAHFDAEHLAALVGALRSQRFLKVRIVGHVYNDENHSAQLSQSLAYAQQLSDVLQEEGIASDRIEAHGVGSLAPMRQDYGGNENDYGRNETGYRRNEKGHDKNEKGQRTLRLEIVPGR